MIKIAPTISRFFKRPGKHQRLLVIVVGLLAIAVFEGVFLNKIFEDAKRERYREARRELAFAHQSILDSLRYEKSLGQMLELLTLASGQVQEGEDVRVEIDGTDTNIFIGSAQNFPGIKKSKPNFYAFEFKDGQPLDGFIDSISKELRSGNSGALMKTVTRETVTQSPGSKQQVKVVTIDTALLNSRVQTRFNTGESKLKITWRISDSITTDGFFTDRFRLSGNQNAPVAFELQGVNRAALGDITMEITLCILLWLFIGFAMLLMYQNAERQSKLLRLKDQLISNISHELKTPVASVKIALESVQKSSFLQEDAKSRNYLTQSEKELNRLQFLIDKVLQASVMEGGVPHIKTERVNLVTATQNCIDALQLLAAEKGCALNMNTSDTAVWVLADPSLLEQALCNVIENAVKYGPSNSDIAITVSQSKGMATVAVIDQGKGIPKAYLSDIFERFFRLPTDNVHDIKGHGLGLHFVKNVVEQHHGNVSATNLNPGFKLTLNLPLA